MRNDKCKMKEESSTARVLAVLLLLAAALPAWGDWPTLHNDNQRSGYSNTVVQGPYERKWYRSLVEELIGARCEAIIAEQTCFVGTYAGNLYALDIADGRTVWQQPVGGPIGHSVCYDQGRVYVCSDDSHARGSLVCYEASSGRELWRYQAAAGFWTAPVCDGPRVYAGDRTGVFHAVDAQRGVQLWTRQTGPLILKPASVSPDGQSIVVGAEDMHVYCFDPAGNLRWKSRKLPGLSLRDAAPTIWDDKVVVRTNPSLPFHTALHEARQLVCDIQRGITLNDQDQVYPDLTRNQYFLRCTPRRERAEHERVVEFLGKHRHSQTWHTLKLSDGTQPWLTSVLYTAGLHNPPSPPTFNPKTGALYTILPTAVGVYSDGVSQLGIGIGRIDSATGYITNASHAHGDRVPGYFAGSTMIADETSTLSLMGQMLLITHQGAVGAVDLQTRKLSTLHGARDSYGGLYGPGVAPGNWDGSKELARQGFVQNTVNEWHGPDRSAVSISDDRLFWVAGSCVVCFGGSDTPSTSTGGRRAPEPWKWQQTRRFNGGNITSSWGDLDATVTRQEFSAADVKQLFDEPDTDRPQLADWQSRYYAELEATVTETIAQDWAPFVVQMGISHEEVSFDRPAQTMLALSQSLPFLNTRLRQHSVEYLDRLFAAGAPLAPPGGNPKGTRREYYELAPETLASVANHRADNSPLDLYALWAYAHYANRWPQVLTRKEAIRGWGFQPQQGAVNKVMQLGLMACLCAQPDLNSSNPQFCWGWKPQPRECNEQIAGVIAYGRIMRRAGDTQQLQRAAEQLAALITERVHLERADQRLQQNTEHYASLARYEAVVPELGLILAQHAKTQLWQNLEAIDCELPVWYQAFGERLVGGENYTNSPNVSKAIFLIKAYSHQTPSRQLTRYLDQPWCHADLAYINKLTALLSGDKP